MVYNMIETLFKQCWNLCGTCLYCFDKCLKIVGTVLKLFELLGNTLWDYLATVLKLVGNVLKTCRTLGGHLLVSCQRLGGHL